MRNALALSSTVHRAGPHLQGTTGGAHGWWALPQPSAPRLALPADVQEAIRQGLDRALVGRWCVRAGGRAWEAWGGHGHGSEAAVPSPADESGEARGAGHGPTLDAVKGESCGLGLCLTREPTPAPHGSQMVVLMDPSEDPEDPLRTHRSREKTFIFDVVFDQSTRPRCPLHPNTCWPRPTKLSSR